MDARLAEEAEQRLLGVARRRPRGRRPRVMPARRRDARDLVLGRGRADVGIEARRGRRDEVDRDGPSPFAAW